MASDMAQVRTNHVEGVEATALAESPGDVFDEEQQRVEQSLLDRTRMLEILPGKDLVSIAARVLGVTRERYIALVNEAIEPSRLENANHAGDDGDSSRPKTSVIRAEHLPKSTGKAYPDCS